jgi:hypothetical protein
MAAARRLARARREEQRGLDAVPLHVPSWCQLVPCQPLEFALGGVLVKVTWHDLVRHATAEAPIAGAVVMANAYTSAMLMGPMGPRQCNLFTYRPRDVLMVEGDELLLSAYKHGKVRLWPFTGDTAEHVRQGLARLDASLGDVDASLDPLDPLADVPLPGGLQQAPRWHP